MATQNHGGVAGDQLLAIIERVERLTEERKAIADDIAEVYGEARGNGFDVPVIKKIVKIRAQDQNERMEQEALLELYLSAIGMGPAYDDDGFDPSHVHVHVREGNSSQGVDAGSPVLSTDVSRVPSAGTGGEADRQTHQAETPNEAAHTSHVGAARQAEEEVRASSAANSEPQPVVTDQNAEANTAQTEGPSSLPTSVAGPEAVESPAINSEAGIPVSASEPVGAPSADADDRDASLASSHTGVPVVISNVSAPRPEGCERPHACGSSSWRKRCFTCQRAWDAAHGQSAGDAA